MKCTGEGGKGDLERRWALIYPTKPGAHPGCPLQWPPTHRSLTTAVSLTPVIQQTLHLSISTLTVNRAPWWFSWWRARLGCSAGDPRQIPGLGRSPGEGTGSPVQETPGGFLGREDPLEKGQAPQFWRPQADPWVGKIPWRRDRLPTTVFLGSLAAQMVKNPPAMQVTLVWSLSQEDPLEKGMVSNSSILAWRTVTVYRLSSSLKMKIQHFLRNYQSELNIV